MSQPPKFDRHTWEDQKDLLKSHDAWQDTKTGWKLFLAGVFILACVAGTVIGLVSLVRGIFFR